MSGTNDTAFDAIDDVPLLAASHEPETVPAANGIWIEDEPEDAASTALQPLAGAGLLGPVRALLPELERRRRGHEDAMIDLRRASREAGPEGWRLRGGAYAGLMLLACLLLAGGAYVSIMPLSSGAFGAAAVAAFAVNIAGLAHLAGGWGRRVVALRSWGHRLMTVLLAAGACSEIAALIYFAGLGWADRTPSPLTVMLCGAMIAVIASALRTRPNPDLARMMRREHEARRDHEAVRSRMLAGIGAARRGFEREAAALEAAASPLAKSVGE